MENKSAFNVNTLLCGMLTIAFVVMKLTGVIDWRWLWVLAPLWIPMGVGLILLIIVLVLQVKIEINKRKAGPFGESIYKNKRGGNL